MPAPQATLELLLPPEHDENLTEGETVILMVNALKPLDKIRLRIGQVDLQRLPPVADNTSLQLEFKVPDYIGANTISLHNAHGNLISNRVEIVIVPAMMDYATYQDLKEKHIPELVKRAGAEDASADAYPGATSSIEEEVIQLNIQQLLEFSRRLLELTQRIRKGAYSYLIEKERKHMKSTIRGAVRWQKTVLARAQKGVDYATVHITDLRKRRWHTPTNLMLVKFHMELFMEALFFRDEMDRREREKKAWAAIYGRKAKECDTKAKKQLEQLDVVCRLHKNTLADGKLGDLIPRAKAIRKESRNLVREGELEVLRLKNRAYRELPSLWQEFLRDYKSYYEDTILIETQRMADVYALWVVTEMAMGMRLRSRAKSLREFRSGRSDIVLRYDAPGQVRQGWSDSIMGMLFDESAETTVPATGSGKPEMFLNYRSINIYFEARYDLQTAPKQEDIYKVLAYMNNYRVPCGGIIYPGPRLKFSYDTGNRQVMAWIPFAYTESAYEVAPDYFAFVADRMAAIQSRLGTEEVAELVAETEAQAQGYYDAIATPGIAQPERAEQLYAGTGEAVEPPETGAPTERPGPAETPPAPAPATAAESMPTPVAAADTGGPPHPPEPTPPVPRDAREPSGEGRGPPSPSRDIADDEIAHGKPPVPRDAGERAATPSDSLEAAHADSAETRQRGLERAKAGVAGIAAGGSGEGDYAIAQEPGGEELLAEEAAEAAAHAESGTSPFTDEGFGADAAQEITSPDVESAPVDDESIRVSLKRLRELVDKSKGR